MNKPEVVSCNPSHGRAKGGTLVTISGKKFNSGAIVTFSGAPGLSINWKNATTIECLTPAAKAWSKADVTVTNPDGLSATLGSGFVFES